MKDNMENKYWLLLILIIGTLGSLYSIVMLIFWFVNDLYSFNFWNSLVCAFGWNLFIITFSQLLNKKDLKSK